MSLDRYSNKNQIIATDGKMRGIEWKVEDQPILQLDTKNITPQELPTVELHLYTPGAAGRHIVGGSIEGENYKVDKDELLIDYAGAAGEMGIERGQFEVVVNIHKNVVGEEGADALYVKEISEDRRELWIQASPGADVNIDAFLDSFGEQNYYETVYETTIDDEGNEIQVIDDQGRPIVKATIERPMSDDIALNFGDNQIYKIVNCKDWDEENDFVVRMYQPIPDTINVKDFLWVVEELSDAYVDNIQILGPGAEALEPRVLRGPNLEVSDQFGLLTETDYKTWNDLLDANLSTSQQIVDSIFSGSLMGVDIGIDYTAFENFVHFSSAKERLEGFKYKLQQIEYYDKQIRTLNTATGDDDGALQGNVAINEQRKDNVIGSFDGFERWLYNEPGSGSVHWPISTHGVSGSVIGAAPYTLEPWPKFVSSSHGTGKYKLHHTTSSFAEDWYNGFIETASLFDIHNENALVKTIPEHIRRDPNNEQYDLFINMIGHHYDILYSYIDNLTRLYKPEDQPKLGQSKEVLYQIAESLGWTLANGQQAEDLWKYKLGTDQTGSYQSTGSMFSKSNEAITTEVWRRIVNNLPFLLKTKGTARSIKTLMNTYGIPQTLLSIREYGGPKVGEDAPLLIEDRFSYSLQLSGSRLRSDGGALRPGPDNNHINFPNQWYSSSITTPPKWGIDRGEFPPLTREWRFKPGTTSSMLMWTNALHFTADGIPNTHQYRPVSHIYIEYTSSLSGSNKYGRVHLLQGGAGNVDPNSLANADGAANKYPARKLGMPMTASTPWVPIYDGNFWNLRYYWQPTSSLPQHNLNVSGAVPTAEFLALANAADNLAGKYHVQVQQASDYITGKIVHSASLSITPETASHWRAYSSTASWNGAAEGDPTDVYYDTGSNQVHESTGGGAMESFLGGQFGGPGFVGGGQLVNNYLSHSLQDNSFDNIITFSGSIQEYREWIEVLDQKTFDLHTLNPTSYVSSISPTASYDTLVRHYPLGTEMIAVDRTYDTIITSSHPAQNKYKDFSPAYNDGANSFATASNFPTPINSERGNYEPVEETYYVQGISLGGTLPKSQKIRLENNELFKQLSPLTSAERSSFDLSPLDSNKLGLFYSHADQLNKEIFNHVGDVALDDFVGDPDDEFLPEYPDLDVFSIEYFKKYNDANDINAYLRVFSQFDFALFNQIKQLLPERVDEAMGLLVEPHTLERAKVILTRRPQKEEPMFNGRIPEPIKVVTASILPLSASIPEPLKIAEAIVHLNTGSGGYSDVGDYVGKIPAIPSPSQSADYCLKEVFPADMTPMFTASVEAVYSVSHSLTGQNFHDGVAAQVAKGRVFSKWRSKGGPYGPIQGGYFHSHPGTISIGPNGARHQGGRALLLQGPYGDQNEQFAVTLNSSSYAGNYDADRGDTSDYLRFMLGYRSSYDTVIDISFEFQGEELNTQPADAGSGFNSPFSASFGARILTTDMDSTHGYDNAHGYHPRYAKHGNFGSGAPIQEESMYKVMTASAETAPIFKTRIIGAEQIISTNPQIVTHANNERSRYTSSFHFKDIKLEKNKKPQVEFFIRNLLTVESDTGLPIKNGVEVTLDRVVPIITVKKVCYDMTDHMIDGVYDQCRKSSEFKKQTFYFGFSGSAPAGDTMHPVDTTGRDTKIGRDHQRYISSSQGSYRDTIYPTLGQRKHKLVESYPGNYTSRSAHLPAPYMDDHFLQTENLFYNGCKLTGPGINVRSDVSAIDGNPVVEVFNVNPNQLIFQRDPQDGIPGNLRIR